VQIYSKAGDYEMATKMKFEKLIVDDSVEGYYIEDPSANPEFPEPTRIVICHTPEDVFEALKQHIPGITEGNAKIGKFRPAESGGWVNSYNEDIAGNPPVSVVWIWHADDALSGICWIMYLQKVLPRKQVKELEAWLETVFQ
jgi:hypothetical protein